MQTSTDGCFEKRRGGSKIAVASLLSQWHLPGTDIGQIGCAEFDESNGKGLRCRASATIARGEVNHAIPLVNGWRTPYSSADTPIGHHVEGVLHGSSRGIQLNELPLYDRTISHRGCADIDASIIDGRRSPDEGIG